MHKMFSIHVGSVGAAVQPLRWIWKPDETIRTVSATLKTPSRPFENQHNVFDLNEFALVTFTAAIRQESKGLSSLSVSLASAALGGLRLPLRRSV